MGATTRWLLLALSLNACMRDAGEESPQPGFEALMNGGFEESPADAWFFCGPPPVEPIGEACGRDDSRGVLFELAADNQWECFSQKLYPRSSTQLIARAWAKRTHELGRAWLSIECVDPDLESSEEDNYGVVGGGSDACEQLGEWTRLEVVLEIPRRTEYLRVFGTANGPAGQVCFDDFELELQ